MLAETGRVVWSPAPDPDAGVYYPIKTPKPGKDVIGIVLSECIVGAVTYYVPPDREGSEGHSLPCTCGESPCPGRVANRDHRWKGFLACWDRSSGRLFIGEVTKEAYLRCPQFEVWKGQLRGKMLKLARSGTARNSRVTAAVTAPTGQLVGLPAAFNVQSALERIWFGSQGERRLPPTAKVEFGERFDDFDGEVARHA